MPARRLVAVGFATIGRAAFGAALAVTVLMRLPAEQSVEVFQLLVLQAVFSTFLSGSAFLRGLADAGDERAAAAMLRGLALTWTGVAAAIALADLTLIPHAFRADHVTADGWKLALLAIGTLATALQTALQGIVAARSGPMRAFLPVGAAFLAMSIPCVLLPPETVGQALGLLVAAQCLALAGLLAATPVARALISRAMSARSLPASGIQARETLAFGSINGLSVLIVFALRAWWSDRVEPELAERMFFAMRLSDVYMQVAYYAVAMSGRLQRLALHEAGMPPGVLLRVVSGSLAAMALASAAVLMLAPAAAASGAVWSGIALFLAAQIIVDITKLPAVALLASAARGRHVARFAALCVIPIAGAAGLAAILDTALPAATMLLYQCFGASLTILLWSALRIRAGRAITGRPHGDRDRP